MNSIFLLIFIVLFEFGCYARNEFTNKRNADLIRLNVGGQEFLSSRETLRNAAKSNNNILNYDLSALNLNENEDQIEKIFIDRNPKHFNFLLDYLRCDNYGYCLKKLYKYLQLNEMMREEILDEVDFYGFADIEKLIVDYFNHQTMTLNYHCDEINSCKEDSGLVCLNSTCQCPIYL